MSVLVCTKEKAQHGTAVYSKNDENETGKIGKKKIPVPSRALISCLTDWNTLHPIKKKRKKNRTEELPSQRRTPSAPLATSSKPI